MKMKTNIGELSRPERYREIRKMEQLKTLTEHSGCTSCLKSFFLVFDLFKSVTVFLSKAFSLRMACTSANTNLIWSGVLCASLSGTLLDRVSEDLVPASPKCIEQGVDIMQKS